MAQTVAIGTITQRPAIRSHTWLAVASLWWRELVRFYRQRSRVAGVILSPLVFWLVIGSGFGT
ncbi:MAG: multidrug ABC transporter permease, partial [Terriglobales bacterium]